MFENKVLNVRKNIFMCICEVGPLECGVVKLGIQLDVDFKTAGSQITFVLISWNCDKTQSK